MEKESKQTKYTREYIREHYKRFKVDLKLKEWEELESLLSMHHLTKAQFLRNAISELKHSHKSH